MLLSVDRSMQTTMLCEALVPLRPFPASFTVSLALWLGIVLLVRVVSAAEPPTGEIVFKAKCASCHGATGEGTSKNYPQPLIGDLSIGELTRYIKKTMPEDKPGTCVGEEAARVAEFIHGAFYSPTAQARNKPARIELSRLTVRQYRNAVADLIGSFRQGAKPDAQQGLRGEYFKSRRHNGKDRVIERIDPVEELDGASGLVRLQMADEMDAQCMVTDGAQGCDFF